MRTKPRSLSWWIRSLPRHSRKATSRARSITPGCRRLSRLLICPRVKELVFYCPCNHDEDSIDMVKKLREFGYLDSKILEGGWYKWVALKYPVAGTDAANAIKEADAAAANGSNSSNAGKAANSRRLQPLRLLPLPRNRRHVNRSAHFGPPSRCCDAVIPRNRRNGQVQGTGHLLRLRIRRSAHGDRLLP